MAGSQKDSFLAGEGNAWFQRNRNSRISDSAVVSGLKHLARTVEHVAEIGCGDGRQIAAVKQAFGARCWAFDPSSDAIEAAKNAKPDIHFAVGTADKIDLPDGSMDVVLFGFCLYLADPGDYFRIAAEGDRVVRDGGLIVIHDFNPGDIAYRNRYAHKKSVYSHKLEFSKLFLCHPRYRLIHRIYDEHSNQRTLRRDESITIDFLFKDAAQSFVAEPSFAPPADPS